ncbi:hypothetical protein ABI59_22460 [Acidobacteria bacterium Mor1]|nr:hypothetical protein ABI59_22460 [Acidobacteria bacterium Mor1]
MVRWRVRFAHVSGSVFAVGLLTLWTYMQCSFFLGQPMSDEHRLVAASHVIRAQPSLWYASFFSAMTLGLSLYGFGYLLRASARHAPVPGYRLARMQAQGLLVLGLWTYAQTYRLMVMSHMIAPTGAWATPALQRLMIDEPYPPNFAPPALLLALSACLAAAVAVLQLWSILPAFRGSRRTLVLVICALLLPGLGIPLGGQLDKIPSAYWPEFLALPSSSEEVRAMLLEDSEAARRAVTTYLTTHSLGGSRVSSRQLRLNSPPESEDLDSRCGLCRLPWTRLLAPTGLHLKLTKAPPMDQRPGLVFEVPRDAASARVYPAVADPALRTVPLAAAANSAGETDWIVLKIDASVPMTVVRSLLIELSTHGVKRVTLAADPRGGESAPANEPLLLFADVPEATPYALEPIRVDGLRPPPGTPCPHFDQYSLGTSMWREPASSPLPRITLFEFYEDAAYGELFGHFQSVFEDQGPDTVVLAPARQSERLD